MKDASDTNEIEPNTTSEQCHHLCTFHVGVRLVVLDSEITVLLTFPRRGAGSGPCMTWLQD